MGKRKYSLFCKGDVIRTNPEPGFYGIAVVLSDGEKTELSPGRWSYPMCHIAITSLLFQYEVSIDDIDISNLKPTTFQSYFRRKDGTLVPYRNKICIDIYTTRNKANLPVIGNIDPSVVYDEPLSYEGSEDSFHLRGDPTDYLGREAYINWCRDNGISLG